MGNDRPEIPDKLPDPDVIAQDIVEDLEAALQFREIVGIWARAEIAHEGLYNTMQETAMVTRRCGERGEIMQELNVLQMKSLPGFAGAEGVDGVKHEGRTRGLVLKYAKQMRSDYSPTIH